VFGFSREWWFAGCLGSGWWHGGLCSRLLIVGVVFHMGRVSATYSSEMVADATMFFKSHSHGFAVRPSRAWHRRRVAAGGAACRHAGRVMSGLDMEGSVLPFHILVCLCFCYG
jgi:hypothetical protein